MTIRILLADDHTLFRAGIRAILDVELDITVIGEAGDGRELLSLATELAPDVILLDISMPGLNGIEALHHIRKITNPPEVIILSMYATEEYVVRALRAGALSYLLKETPANKLLAAIRAAGHGEQYLCPPLTHEVIADYLRRLESKISLIDHLTPREREVLQLLAEGNTTLESAANLGVSPKTVETHRANLMDKLNLYDIASLTRFALRYGLIKE